MITPAHLGNTTDIDQPPAMPDQETRAAQETCAAQDSRAARESRAADDTSSQDRERLPAHVVLLTNFIPPYRLPLYRELSRRVRCLTILISTPMEANRSWNADWGDLEVEVQNTWTIPRRWRHSAGFEDTLQVHVPLDTLARLRRLRPDVVVSAELGFRSLQSVRYCRNSGSGRGGRRVPLVLWATVSESTERGRGAARQVLRKWLLRQADRVVVNGESGARYIGRFGVDDCRIDRIPYTATTTAFGNGPLARPSERAHDLVFAGQLIERKGLLPFLHVLRRWAVSHADRRLRFLIAGTGPQRAELEQFGWPENVRPEFLGQQDYEQLAHTYARGGIFVFPTLADEWGLVVNEAMAAGLPVLGSLASQAVEELCEHGRTGWCFRPEDPDQMALALSEALALPADHLEPMREAARRRTQSLTAPWAAARLAGTLRAACTTTEPLHGRRP